MSRDPDRYSDEDLALILHKATELARRSEVRADPSAGLSLEEIKAIGAEVGIDPALIERAARLVPRRSSKTLFERIIGGPWRHRVDLQFPTALTQDGATHLLSAVRAATDKQGQGQADAAGMSWHSEPAASRVSVTAHADHEGTNVHVVVDRSTAFIPVAVMGLMAMIFWAFVMARDVESLVDLFLYLSPAAGGLAIARALWASSTRAIEERTTALLNAVRRSMAESSPDSDDE